MEANAGAYARLVRGGSAVPEVREIVDAVRTATAARILAGLAGAGATEPPPALRVAVRAWLWFMDGAILDWLEHGGIDRAELHRLLVATLEGAIAASAPGAAR